MKTFVVTYWCHIGHRSHEFRCVAHTALDARVTCEQLNPHATVNSVAMIVDRSEWAREV